MSAPNGPTLASLTGAPGLTALIPLLYVAWADGALGDAELRSLRDAAHRTYGASQADVLDTWLDEKSPPSSTELMRLRRFVRERLSRLDAASRGNLVDLGCSIAKLEKDTDDPAATHRALQEIEEALGIVSTEAARAYFEDRPPIRQDFDEPPPRFEVERMTQRLDGDQADTWENVRAWVRRPEMAIASGLSRDEQRTLVRQRLLALAEDGIGRLSFAPEYGGEGRIDEFMKTFEALGMHDLSLVVKLGVQFGLFGGAIANLGDDEQCRRYLPQVGSGELLGGFAMTELGHGSNVRDIETVARYDPERDAFVLHTPSVSARKEWIGNAAVDGQAMVVFAQLESGGESRGVHAFFVPIRDERGHPSPGCHIEDCGSKMGLEGVDNGRLWFDNVEVPRDRLLARFGRVDAEGNYNSPIADDSRRFFTMLGTLVTGRISVAAAAVTASKTALATAIRYGALRRQFGPAGRPETSILDYPTVYQRLLPQLAATYAFHFAVDDLQRRFIAHPKGGDSRELEAQAAGLKALATWHGIDAIQTARECCGGMGFLTVNRICQLRRDIDVFATFEGDNTVLLQLAARSAMNGFGKQLSDDFVSTILSEIATRAKVALLEQNPVAKRRTDHEHLLDPDFHRDAFRFRAHNLLVSAARRFEKRTRAGQEAFDAFNEIQDHCVALARAHVEEQVHTCFADAVEATSDSAVRDALASLRGLWALSRLRADVGWFLENDYIGARKARALRKALARQCSEVRIHAVALVDGFGIPDEMLGPIAFENYAEHAMLGRREETRSLLAEG